MAGHQSHRTKTYSADHTITTTELHGEYVVWCPACNGVDDDLILPCRIVRGRRFRLLAEHVCAALVNHFGADVWPLDCDETKSLAIQAVFNTMWQSCGINLGVAPTQEELKQQ